MTTRCFSHVFCGAFGYLVLLTSLVVSVDSFCGQVSAGQLDIGSVTNYIDLRPAFEKWELGPHIQGKRNTCSVFTVTGALEYALASKRGEGTQLSVEFLNWASNKAMNETNDGSFFSDLWRGFEMYGVCPEQDMPYQDTFDPKQAPSEQARDHARQLHEMGFRLHWIKPWNPNTGLTEKQLAAIKRVLGRQWPVCGGFRWPKNVQWKNDVLGTPPPEGVFDGHSVLIVGYQDSSEQPGGGVLIFRNSNNGGRDGYMTYEYASAYMNDAVWIDYEEDDAAQSSLQSLSDVMGPMSFFPKGRNRRVSSNQQPGWHTENLDMNWLMPGQSVDMPVLEGPGVVTHIWFTSHSGWVGELHSLTLRIYYDDCNEPGVEVPVGDFFAVGHGKPAVVNSIPVQVSPTGSLSCYWRMPFRKKARIVVTNDNPDRSTGLYWQVDWVQLDSLPPETPYFYARYRWHMLDPVNFSESLKVAIEHRGNYDESEDGFFLERPDFYSSVAYWYQTGRPQTSFPPLPSWHERRVPWQRHHLVKTYRYAKTSGQTGINVQTQGFFGARPVLAWPNQEPGAMLTLPFKLAEDGRFAIRLTAANGPHNGTFDISIDGQKVITADFRTPEDTEADLRLGTHELGKGNHKISFRASEHAEHIGLLGVEVLRLLKLPPATERTEKTHHEAHFIRLGIGRAIYAYRLAFDALPDSLEMLVEKGFMPARYLRDENNLPLKCWREGDTMYVESPGKDHWKHSWKGLDPRR